MESIINTFHIDWEIIVAQAINFIIVFSVLYIFALKPLGKLMAERSEKIAKGVSDAKKNAEILSSTQKEYDEALSKAKAEANAILQEGKKIAETKKNEMMEEAKAEVAKIVSNGKKTMEAEKVKMVEEAKKEIVTLAIEATKKIMEGQTK
jgi:F-type H+-transporting ATPase subunit b